MKIKSISELFEVYDYIKEHCREDPLLKDLKVMRRWLEEASLIRSIYVLRGGSKIDGIAFVWPTDEVPKMRETPCYTPEGDILWCQYCYASDRKRGDGKVMARFLSGVMREFPQVKTLAYRRTKKNNAIYTWPLAVGEKTPIEEEVQASG